MERQIILKRTSEVLRETAILSAAIRALEAINPSEDHKQFSQLAVDAALRAEQITCRLRHLIYASTSVNKKKYLRAAAAVNGIQIVQCDSIVEIVLPGLLAKRRRRGTTEFFLDPLYFTLSDYVEANQVQRFDECVVCFVHTYAKELPARRMRDYDNLELKGILDIIAGFVMTDDSGVFCDTYNTTEFGDEDRTIIAVMSKDSFVKWLSKRVFSSENTL